jgi:hypothetical protein
LASSTPYVNSTQLSQGLSMFDGALGGGNFSFPSIGEQQILPTVIESRRLSMSLGFDGEHGSTNAMDPTNTGTFMPRNDLAQRRIEAEGKASGSEGGDFPQRAIQNPGEIDEWWRRAYMDNRS